MVIKLFFYGNWKDKSDSHGGILKLLVLFFCSGPLAGWVGSIGYDKEFLRKADITAFRFIGLCSGLSCNGTFNFVGLFIVL